MCLFHHLRLIVIFMTCPRVLWYFGSLFNAFWPLVHNKLHSKWLEMEKKNFFLLKIFTKSMNIMSTCKFIFFFFFFFLDDLRLISNRLCCHLLLRNSLDIKWDHFLAENLCYKKYPYISLKNNNNNNSVTFWHVRDHSVKYLSNWTMKWCKNKIKKKVKVSTKSLVRQKGF